MGQRTKRCYLEYLCETKLVFSINSTHWLLFFYLIFSHFSTIKDIDFEGFRKFLDLFLDCDTPKELSKHLFLSFLRPYQSQIAGNMTLSCMAAISSNTCMAPVTSHNTRGTFHCIFTVTNFNHLQWHKKESQKVDKKSQKYYTY